MAKSPDAFRTISEVAEWLDRPAHVLRFWESKFTQVKPVKRAGGRRYYRPQDMLLLGGIKTLLHDEGMTIKGVQKLLREHGVSHVAGMSQPLDGEEEIAASATELPEAAELAEVTDIVAAEAEPDNLVSFPAPDSAAEAAAPASAAPEAEPAATSAEAPQQASLFDMGTVEPAPETAAAADPAPLDEGAQLEEAAAGEDSAPVDLTPSEALPEAASAAPDDAATASDADPAAEVPAATEATEVPPQATAAADTAPKPAAEAPPDAAPFPGHLTALLQADHRLAPDQAATAARLRDQMSAHLDRLKPARQKP